ncbi:MAG: zeta toxin family protein [Alphaproteobacteria bacterium]|nr:zeta toxin family protein [Alphaproteobacteria bacterium]
MILKTIMPSLPQLITDDYAAVKSAESEKIIAKLLEGLSPVKEPEFCQVSGIPGSGKSTFCKKHLPKNYLFLSFDQIMISLFGYQQMLKTKGIIAAYQQYEMTARIIGYEVLRRALQNHLNIMLEHSGTNQAHLELFKNLPKEGYKTTVDFIICDIDLAIKRAHKRALETKRYVPEQLIVERAEKFNQYRQAYQNLANKVISFDGQNNFKIIK